MVKYREVIYGQYFTNQVNKAGAEQHVLLKQQSFYYGKELIPFLPKDKSSSIVDIGCGFGSFVAASKEAGYTNITGIDLSEEQVKTAHSLGINEVKLQTADQFFQETGQVDCIVGVDIIEHFTKDELIDFLLKTKEHLNKQGKIMFRTPNMDTPYASVYAFADISHEVFLNKSSALQLLNSCGFKNVQVHSSLIFNQNPMKEIIRKFSWKLYSTWMKAVLFSSGRTWQDVVFTPNLIITAEV